MTAPNKKCVEQNPDKGVCPKKGDGACSKGSGKKTTTRGREKRRRSSKCRPVRRRNMPTHFCILGCPRRRLVARRGGLAKEKEGWKEGLTRTTNYRREGNGSGATVTTGSGGLSGSPERGKKEMGEGGTKGRGHLGGSPMPAERE